MLEEQKSRMDEMEALFIKMGVEQLTPQEAERLEQLFHEWGETFDTCFGSDEIPTMSSMLEELAEQMEQLTEEQEKLQERLDQLDHAQEQTRHMVQRMAVYERLRCSGRQDSTVVLLRGMGLGLVSAPFLLAGFHVSGKLLLAAVSLLGCTASQLLCGALVAVSGAVLLFGAKAIVWRFQRLNSDDAADGEGEEQDG